MCLGVVGPGNERSEGAKVKYWIIAIAWFLLVMALAACSVRFPNGAHMSIGETERAGLATGPIPLAADAAISAPGPALNRALALCPLLAPAVQVRCLVSQL